jgi:zinc protease
MKRILSSLLTFALAATLLSAQTQAPAKSATGNMPAGLQKIQVPPLRPFKPEQPKRIQLPNGAVLFLIEDHEIPLIGFTAQFRGGSRDEPAAKVGLADIFGEVWRTGGTANKTGDQIDDFLEMRAAKLETNSGTETTSISGDCLKQDFDAVFAQMLELIQSPAFREDKIELSKQQAQAGISRRNDDADAIASRESVMLAYGKTNPYARIAEYATVGAITRDDLIKWHKQYIVPNNMIFGIAGDFDSAQMEAKLRKAFGDLPKGTPYKGAEIPFKEPKPGIYFVEKDDVNQSQIRMVALGTERKNPDYFALRVMNEAFGGGFASRLFSRIRTAQGLAYAVGGAYGAGWDHPGIFDVSTSTKSGTTAQAIESLFKEVDNASAEPFTAEEISRAKDALLNQFVFRYDSKEKVLRERMTLEFYGYPADFNQRFYEAVQKMTPEDVNRVAKKYINRAALGVLVVGNSKEFGTNLSKFGSVTPLDISIPEPANAAASGDNGAAPKQTSPEAKALLGKALAFFGGADKLAAVKSVSYTQRIQFAQGIELTAQSSAIFPDRARQVLTTPQGEFATVVGPSGSFMQMGGQTQPMPKSQSDEYVNGMKRDPYFVAQHANDPAYTVAVNGTKDISGKQAQVLAISGEGQEFQWFVEPSSGQVLGEQHHGMGQSGPVTTVETYAGFTSVDGIKVPSDVSLTQNGQPFATVKIEGYKINPQLDSSIFEKPKQ